MISTTVSSLLKGSFALSGTADLGIIDTFHESIAHRITIKHHRFKITYPLLAMSHPSISITYSSRGLHP